ncbi:phosphoglycerate mutase-like protein [Hypoxylon crocopeplum]|nr:phosphoglycerate mutase-like protein [Hypoxylon crocopeplum]
MTSRSVKALAIGLSFVSEALAQSANETVWSSFAFVLYGEHTPLTGQSQSLTPMGAQQLYSQGSLFRARYLSNSSLSDEDNAITTNAPIVGIERQALDNSQLDLYSSTDDFIVGGALAFLQGLYPPVTREFAYNNGGDNASILANGTMINYPLDGYQYPNIQTASITYDPASVWINGHVACTEYSTSGYQFRSSEIGEETYNSTLAFYETTWAQVFPNTLPNSILNYDYAYDLYDYAQYAYDHDESVRDALNEDRLSLLRTLASNQQFNLNGDLTVSGSQEGDMIRAISGRMLAAKIVSQLSAHISSGGASNKMTLMFGSFEPFLAFFALSDLAYTATSGLFREIPQPGAAMVFELFTTDDDSTAAQESNAWVRFLYRNGTDPDAPLTEYPLFGRGNSETRMRWNDFVAGMQKFSIREVSTWCDTCGAITSFCSWLSESSSSPSDSSSSSSGDSNSNRNMDLSPAVAGVIGAVTTLAVLFLVGMTAFVFGGLRIRRRGHPDAATRHSSLGGFKGAEKMASDHDVSVAKTGVRHERVGSWELSGPNPAGAVTAPAPVAVAESGPGSTVFGASLKRDAKDYDDGDSITGLVPVNPVERV